MKTTQKTSIVALLMGLGGFAFGMTVAGTPESEIVTETVTETEYETITEFEAPPSCEGALRAADTVISDASQLNGLAAEGIMAANAQDIVTMNALTEESETVRGALDKSMTKYTLQSQTCLDNY